MTAQEPERIFDKTCDTQFLWSLFEGLQEGVFAIEKGKFILVNQALCDLIGYEKSELIGLDFTAVIAHNFREMVLERAQARLRGLEPPDQYEIQLITKDEQLLSVQIKVSTFEFRDQTIVNVGSVRNVTTEKKAMQQLKASELEFRRIVENLPDLFYRTDSNGLITMASPYAAEILGYELDDIIGKPILAFYARPEEREPILSKIIEGRGEMVPVESCLRHRDGSLLWVATHAFAQFDEQGNFVGVEGVARNITERKHLEERLRHMAIRDPLTLVFNRYGFDECLARAINRARRNKELAALLFFDLDKFKDINDNYGHDVGDQYLAAFARRLKIGFRETDTVGRLGGDEFVVLLESLENEQQIFQLLERALTALSDPFVNDELSLSFSFSYGIAQYPDDGNDVESLLKFADSQMYIDKRRDDNKR